MFFLDIWQLNGVDMRITHWNSGSVYLPSCYQAWLSMAYSKSQKVSLGNKFACLSFFVEGKLVYSKVSLCDVEAGSGWGMEW